MESNCFVSPNLIDQVQILLKKEAGFESFNFHDHSFDSSQSSAFLDEAIAGSNPSVDALRCKNCSGELLRGSESIICVYCGHSQLQDFLRQPISFKNTFAFQWFLKSLDLDGFEKVGLPLGGNESSDRGRISVKEEEILLSDYLDLQLKWPDDSRGFGVQNEEQLPGKRYLRLIGVDIEQILAQECIDHDFSVGDEHAIRIQNIGNEKSRISGERSLSLFENRQSTEAVSRSGEGGESFFDWGAEFQSAFPDSGHENSANSLISDAPSGSNLTTSKNLWSNSESGSPFNSKFSDENILIKGDEKATKSVDASFDWLPADQRPAIKDDSPNNEKGDGDDSFDDWGDFRMSKSDNITQSEPSTTSVPGIDISGGLVKPDPFNDFTGFVISKSSLTELDDAWNTFTTPSTGGEIDSQIISDKTKQHVGTDDPALGGEIDLAPLDGTYTEFQGINVDMTQNKISNQGRSIGLWNNDLLLGINGELDQLQGGESKLPASGTANEFGNSFDLWNDFKGPDNQQQATNRGVIDNKVSTEEFSTFDAWNDFAGLSIEKKEEQAGSFEVVVGKKSSNQSESLTLWNANSPEAWSDFAGFSGVSDSKLISNDNSFGAWNDFSSIIASHANEPQSSNRGTTEDEAVLKDDNLFSSWGDFRSLGAETGNNFLGPIDTKRSSDQIGFQKASNSLKEVDDNSTFSSWGGFGGATTIIEQQLQVAGVGSSENKQYTNQADNRLQCDVESTRENDDSFGAWTDFTSSSNVQGNLSSSANASDDKDAVNGDLFDAWNVIVSSPKVQAGKDTTVATVKTPESNLFSLNMNSQYVGPNSLMPLDTAGMFSHQNGSAPVPFSPPEGPDLVRTEHGDVKADVNGMSLSGSTSKEALDLKSSVAETLISEMHDLSFMLDSSLSIPNRSK